MYRFVSIIFILQTIRCEVHRETQIMFKAEPKDGCSIYTDHHGIAFKKFLQETHFYVDKTLLLKEVFSKNITNILITAPKKWGKSMNLRMMELFLEMQPTENLSMVPPEQTIAYKFFVEGKTMSSHGLNMDYQFTPVPMKEIRFNTPPLISKHPDFIAEHLARHAVIYLNVADFGPAFTFDEFFLNFKTAVSKIFKRHKHAREAMEKKLQSMKVNVSLTEIGLVDSLLESETKQFDQFLDTDDKSQDDWTISIVFLCELLSEYYKAKVIILLDNHDHMIKMMSFMSKGQRNKVAEFMLDFFEDTFVFNPNLYKCIASGILPMVIKDMARGAHNDFVYWGNIFNEMYPYYGFSKSEYKQLAERLRTTEEHYEEAEKLYGGYFNDTVLNPFDISNFLNTYKSAHFWAQEDGVDVEGPHIEPNSTRHIIIRRLLHDQCIPLNNVPWLPLGLSYDDDKLFSSVWLGRESIEMEDADRSLLYGISTPGPKLGSEEIKGLRPFAERKPKNVNTTTVDDFLLFLLAKGIVTTEKQGNQMCVRVPNEECKSIIRLRFPRPNSFTGKPSDMSDYSVDHPEF